MDEMPTRVCTKCSRELPATTDFFYANQRVKSGLMAQCRDCQKAACTAYRLSHSEQVRERERRYRADPVTGEKKRRQNRDWHDAHREQQNEKRRQLYVERREYFRMQVAESRANNPAQQLFRRWREQGCIVCGIKDVRLVQGHHIDPSEKESKLAIEMDLATMQAELVKCVPVCANHHILIHHEMRNGSRDSSLEAIVAFLKE